jgi:hypothetical protein
VRQVTEFLPEPGGFMKKTTSKVVLNRETLHLLDPAALNDAAGGINTTMASLCCATRTFTFCNPCSA